MAACLVSVPLVTKAAAEDFTINKEVTAYTVKKAASNQKKIGAPSISKKAIIYGANGAGGARDRF